MPTCPKCNKPAHEPAVIDKMRIGLTLCAVYLCRFCDECFVDYDPLDHVTTIPVLAETVGKTAPTLIAHIRRQSFPGRVVGGIYLIDLDKALLYYERKNKGGK